MTYAHFEMMAECLSFHLKKIKVDLPSLCQDSFMRAQYFVCVRKLNDTNILKCVHVSILSMTNAHIEIMTDFHI